MMLLCQRQVRDNQDMDDYLNLKLARVPSWIHPWQDPSSLLLHLQRLAPLISTWNLPHACYTSGVQIGVGHSGKSTLAQGSRAVFHVTEFIRCLNVFLLYKVNGFF